MAKLTKKQVVLLAAVVAAGESGTFAQPTDLKNLVAEGLVETNEEMKQEDGSIACRATEAGMKYGELSDEPASESTSGFTLATVELPARSRGGAGRAAKYPFDDMEEGQSFFVPVSESRKTAEDVAKGMASTVSSAMQRYAVEHPEGKTKVNRNGDTVIEMVKTREFTVRPVQDGSPWGAPGVAGAGIWRTK